MSAFGKFDYWVRSGPFTSLDLGIYRIIYSCGVLCMVPSIQWLAGYPDSMLHAPLGPLQFLSGYPSLVGLVVLELLRSLALVLLGIGIWTRWVSMAVAVLLLVTYGLTYTLGKIDHTILFVLAPLILAFSGWGDRLSLDALLRRLEPKPTPQWPLRFLALVIGLCFFEAAAIKLGTGWLSWSSQATQGHFLDNFVTNDRSSWLAMWAFHFNVRPAWEALDWMTVILEFSILATVPWWRAFRIALACATVFHLSILVIMNIGFSGNVIVYGAFVSWGVFATRGLATRALGRTDRGNELGPAPVGRGVVAFFLLSGFAVSVAAWLVMTDTDMLAVIVSTFILFGGAAVGFAYLVNQAIVGARKLTWVMGMRKSSIGSRSPD